MNNFKLIKFRDQVNANFIDVVKEKWDYPLSGCATIEEFVTHSMKHNSVVYWVTNANQLIGILEFARYTESGAINVKTGTVIPNMVDIGIYIAPEYRGKGLPEILILSSLKVFREMDIPLVATVSVENRRSLGIGKRNALDSIGVEVYETVRDRQAVLFDLSLIPLELVTADYNIVKSLLKDNHDIKYLIK